MIRRAEEMEKEIKTGMRGGKGNINFTHILGSDELAHKGRLFSKLTIKPGMSIGPHKHEGEFEAFYVIKGEGMFDDNGTKAKLNTGDLAVTGDGKSHAIENTGKDDLELIALILFE